MALPCPLWPCKATSRRPASSISAGPCTPIVCWCSTQGWTRPWPPWVAMWCCKAWQWIWSGQCAFDERGQYLLLALGVVKTYAGLVQPSWGRPAILVVALVPFINGVTGVVAPSTMGQLWGGPAKLSVTPTQLVLKKYCARALLSLGVTELLLLNGRDAVEAIGCGTLVRALGAAESLLISHDYQELGGSASVKAMLWTAALVGAAAIMLR